MDAEVRKFDALAHEFWDKRGAFHPLHALNPVRFDYVAQRATLAQRRVLDIGCGGGALLEYLGRRLGVEVIGVDQKPPATTVVPVIEADAVTQKLPDADVAVCTLTAHHLKPEEIVALIRNVRQSARRFIVHDLIRHPVPLALFTMFLCPLIGKEAAADGRLSIRRAYTPEEFAAMARTALAGTNGIFMLDVSRFRSRQIVDIRFS